MKPRLTTLRMALDRAAVLNATEKIVSVTQVLSSLEYLSRERDRAFGGPNNWDVIGERDRARMPRLAKALDLVGGRRATRALHVARVAAAASLWAPLPPKARVAANAVLVGGQLALNPRHHYGTDGADQMSFVVQTMAMVARMGRRNPAAVDACLWAISLHSVLSYTVSGWAKMPSETWRSGEALPGVIRTRTYGDQSVWKLFDRYPTATRWLAHGVLALECAFPLVFAAKGRLAPLMLGSAGAFHLANAKVMGLGRFFWAFASTYPAVLYTSGDRAKSRRDDTVPLLFALVLLGLAALGQAQRVKRKRIVLAGRDGGRTMTTRSGNVLSYRVVGAPDAPLVIFENALCATTEHWEWIVGGLGGDYATLTYDRAGYGPSKHTGGDFGVDGAVADLVDLVSHVAPDRKVVLVGHSLGGYLALRAAAELGDQVRGVGLVDPSHPAELHRSERQKKGAESLSHALRLLPGSVRAGMGGVLQRPAWVDRLPEHVRDRALAQYRDSRLWSTAVREWNATKAHFQDFDDALPAMACPMLVITAGQTARTDPEQSVMHDELAALAPWSRRHLIEDTDHDRVVTDEGAATRVAAMLGEFIADLDKEVTTDGRAAS